MSRAPKIKIVAARMLTPKTARPIGPVARRTFPAWIDANERGVAFSAAAVMPRVRDGLVLRMVGRTKLSAAGRKPAHVPGAR